MIIKKDTYWMNKAIAEAISGKTPFGAIIVNEKGEYISGFNTTKVDGATAHAEINVIGKLNRLNYNKPQSLTLYSTVEPCPMCMSAVIWAKIGSVVFGASIEDASKYGNQINITCQKIIDHAWYPIVLKSGIERERCKALLKNK